MKTIAVLMGGYSGEYEVSLKSGAVVYKALVESKKFKIYRVEIFAERWEVLDDKEHRYPINRADFSFERQGEVIHFDAVFNAIHGHPGEDGPLSSYFDLLGIPYTNSGAFPSALTFNKAECNLVLQKFGIQTPQALFLIKSEANEEALIAQEIGFPCFVKPCRSGSSIGVSRVASAMELGQALKTARLVDHKILIEKEVKGKELACGVSDHSGKVQALAVTHIQPPSEWFDYQSKYSGETAEITPAEIDAAVYQKIMQISEEVYQILELKGLARVDFILNHLEEPVLIEVNTVPGFSEESILPKQAAYLNIPPSALFSASVESCLTSKA